MVNLIDLPTEIILGIAKYLQPSDEHMPVIGYNGALLRRRDYQKHAKGVGEAPNDIAALRLTDHHLNKICSPFLFRTLNLITYGGSRCDDVLDIEKNQSILAQHWEHIRTIRVLIDGNIDPAARCERVARFLENCVNLRSLGLYYFSGATDTTLLAESVVKLIENGQLDTLGVYSDMVIESHPERGWESLPINAPMTIVQSVLDSDKASDSLHVLDITTEAMYPDVYDGIRSGLKNLRSLTVHRAFRYTLGDMWHRDAHLKWSPKVNLTRLQLINCQNAYAPLIPSFVNHFDSIRELWVVACGHHTDLQSNDRPRGWSNSPNAIHKTRAPLDELLIEHMDEWEVLSLGRLSTKRLVLISMGPRSVLRTLLRDPEVFPGTKVLVTVPNEPNDLSQSNDPKSNDPNNNGVTLEIFCNERGIEWRKEGERLRFCNALCCRDQW